MIAATHLPDPERGYAEAEARAAAQYRWMRGRYWAGEVSLTEMERAFDHYTACMILRDKARKS